MHSAEVLRKTFHFDLFPGQWQGVQCFSFMLGSSGEQSATCQASKRVTTCTLTDIPDPNSHCFSFSVQNSVHQSSNTLLQTRLYVKLGGFTQLWANVSTCKERQAKLGDLEAYCIKCSLDLAIFSTSKGFLKA